MQYHIIKRMVELIYQKSLLFMHKSVLSKTSPTNELGLMPYLRPKLLIQEQVNNGTTFFF